MLDLIRANNRFRVKSSRRTAGQSFMGLSMRIDVSRRIADCLARGRGVVALESTLIAQGLPWPENLQTARAAEAAVRSRGVEPASIAVVAGRVRVGLEEDELEEIARSGRFRKVSRRDLGWAVATKSDAATTVSATLFIARAAGIHVMATGGIGGVHRGASTSFDISSDLDELACASGAVVVCSGVKSILDIPATLEVLETRGVLVLGYRTQYFPAFTAGSTGLRLNAKADSASEAARIVSMHRALGIPGAVLLAQEVSGDLALPQVEFEKALSEAIQSAQSQGVSGPDVTPFLLEQIRLKTQDRSLRANQSLIVANAGLAAQVAAALALDEASETDERTH